MFQYYLFAKSKEFGENLKFSPNSLYQWQYHTILIDPLFARLQKHQA